MLRVGSDIIIIYCIDCILFMIIIYKFIFIIVNIVIGDFIMINLQVSLEVIMYCIYIGINDIYDDSVFFCCQFICGDILSKFCIQVCFSKIFV